VEKWRIQPVAFWVNVDTETIDIGSPVLRQSQISLRAALPDDLFPRGGGHRVFPPS
jgi:hypothetical protein